MCEGVVICKIKNNDKQCMAFGMEITWEWHEKSFYTLLLTLSDVSSLTPGYVLEELFKHPVCLFWVNKARDQINPKEEKDKEKMEVIHTSRYALTKYFNFQDS